MNNFHAQQEARREELSRTSVFPCGRQLVQLGPDTYKLLDAMGNPLNYLRAEHVDVRPTISEQRLVTR